MKTAIYQDIRSIAILSLLYLSVNTAYSKQDEKFIAQFECSDLKLVSPLIADIEDQKNNISIDAKNKKVVDPIDEIKFRNKLKVSLKLGENLPFFNTKDEFVENIQKASENLNDKVEVQKYLGIDIPIAVAICKELGLKYIEFNYGNENFDDVVQKLIRSNDKTYEADIAISKLSITSKRLQKVLFSVPYARYNHGLLVNRKRLAAIQGTLGSIIDLMKHDNLKIGVIRKSSYHLFAKETLNIPEGNIVKFYRHHDDILKNDNKENEKNCRNKDEWQCLIDAVKKGEDVQVAYRDVFEIKKALTNDYNISVDLASVSLKEAEDQIAIAVNKDNLILKYWIDNFLEKYLNTDVYIKQVISKEKANCYKLIYGVVNYRYYKQSKELLCNNIEKNYYDVESTISLYKDMDKLRKKIQETEK